MTETETETETDIISEGVPCACVEVHYNPKYHDDGTARDRWTCKLCGMEYVKIDIFTNLAESLEFATEEMTAQQAYIESLEQEMEDLDEMLDGYRNND